MGIHVGRKPIAESRNGANSAGRIDGDRLRVYDSRAWRWWRTIQRVADGRSRRIRGDHQLERISVESTII